jgi:hypothetical protein
MRLLLRSPYPMTASLLKTKNKIKKKALSRLSTQVCILRFLLQNSFLTESPLPAIDRSERIHATPSLDAPSRPSCGSVAVREGVLSFPFFRRPRHAAFSPFLSNLTGTRDRDAYRAADATLLLCYPNSAPFPLTATSGCFSTSLPLRCSACQRRLDNGIPPPNPPGRASIRSTTNATPLYIYPRT